MSSVSVRIDKNLFDAAAIEGKAEYRSAAQQINFWANVGRNALANPDLPIDFIAELLVATNQSIISNRSRPSPEPTKNCRRQKSRLLTK